MFRGKKRKGRENPLVPVYQLQGKVSHDQGAEFENIIQMACDRYREQGIADIEKTPEPTQVIQNNGKGKFTVFFKKKAQPDFQGTLNGGKSICFEAKHTKNDRIKKDALTAEQSEVLERKSKMGAECFVLVSFGFQSYYKFPWSVWANMKELYGHQYITPEEGAPYKIKNSGGYRIEFL